MEFTAGIYGAILSTILLLWTVWTYFKENRPKLKVSVNFGFTGIKDNKSIGNFLIFTAVNLGKKPIFIHSAGLGLEHGNIYLDKSFSSKKLVPGDSYEIIESFEKIKKRIGNSKDKLRNVWFKDKTGKKYISSIKNIKNLF
jgi:hypothetical protein